MESTYFRTTRVTQPNPDYESQTQAPKPELLKLKQIIGTAKAQAPKPQLWKLKKNNKYNNRMMGKALAQKNLTVKAQVEQTEDMAAMREVTCPHSPTAYLMGKLMGWQITGSRETGYCSYFNLLGRKNLQSFLDKNEQLRVALPNFKWQLEQPWQKMHSQAGHSQSGSNLKKIEAETWTMQHRGSRDGPTHRGVIQKAHLGFDH